jgi:succinate dehydrogenase / fumarate reductase, membrane anchor subunit
VALSRNAIWWYVQRVTGALLVPLLLAHFWVEHFMSRSLLRGDLTYEAILGRIANPVWQAVDIGFLFVALVHGLNGLRAFVLDYGRVGPRAARAVTASLVILGTLWLWWGIEAFSRL